MTAEHRVQVSCCFADDDFTPDVMISVKSYLKSIQNLSFDTDDAALCCCEMLVSWLADLHARLPPERQAPTSSDKGTQQHQLWAQLHHGLQQCVGH